MLKPGGALIIATPIIDAQVFYATHHIQNTIIPLASRGRSHAYPWGLFLPYHTFVQSTKSLEFLLQRHGFEVVHLKKFPWNSWYKMNLKWRIFYHVMNGVFRLLRSGQNIDVLAVQAP